MDPQSRSHFADRVIAAIAGRQFGVVAGPQLLHAGVSDQQIKARLASGRLTELHRGVYLVGAVQPEHAHEMAALLACGEVPSVRIRGGRISLAHNQRPKAVLSHQSAAHLWDLLPYPASGHVCVTSHDGRGGTRPRIESHRATLHRRDIRRRRRMPLTSPPRTILDLAAEHGAKARANLGALDPHRLSDLEQLVAQAQYRGLASDAELRDQIERNPHRPGIRALRAILDLPGGPRRTDSPAERALLRLLRERGIEGYEVNAKVAGWEVDFLWRGEKLAVEVDGYDGHSGRVAFERDRLKAATLKANGISVMPVTGRQIKRDPDGVIARLLAALGRS